MTARLNRAMTRHAAVPESLRVGWGDPFDAAGTPSGGQRFYGNWNSGLHSKGPGGCTIVVQTNLSRKEKAKQCLWAPGYTMLGSRTANICPYDSHYR